MKMMFFQAGFIILLWACQSKPTQTAAVQEQKDTVPINNVSEKEEFIPHITSFHDTILQKAEVFYPIFQSYDYKENNENVAIILTQNSDKDPNANSNSSHIVAHKLIKTSNTLTSIWRYDDQIKPLADGGREKTIHWLGHYSKSEDADQDGNQEQYLTYVTEGNNNNSDGRLVLMINYQDKKIFIKHQNGVLDFQRKMKVEPAFYKLPLKVKNTAISILKEIEKDEVAILPFSWEQQMSNEILIIKE
jgi:hypothetical protein